MQTFEIATPPLFNFSESLWFLNRNLDDCMHYVTDAFVRKLIPVNSKPVLFEVSENKGALQIKILKGIVSDSSAIVTYLNEWLDMDRDIKPFYTLLKKDVDLADFAKIYKGFHMVGIPYLFETLCWCVIGQQINLNFAYKIKRRLVEAYGENVVYDGKSYFLFPEPETIKKIKIAELKELQLTTRKAEYIIGIAEKMSSGRLGKKKLQANISEAEMLQELLQV